MKKKKLLFFIALDLLLIIGLIFYFGFIQKPVPIRIHGTYLTRTLDFPDFQLQNYSGKSLSKKDLLGHWTMLYFGFSHCPKICPDSMAVLNQWHSSLQGELPPDLLPKIWFISVDPKRDSLKRIQKFVQSFNPKFLGARGSNTDILKLQQALHMMGSEDNPLNHSMDMILINPNASICAYFSYPQNAKALTEDFKQILAQYSHA